MNRALLALSLRASVAISSAVAGLFAQCGVEWVQGGILPGTDAHVWASAQWDPDGTGPLPPRLVIGGDFYAVGNTLCNRIAMRDPVTGSWAPLGNGLNDTVSALVAMPNGDLIVGGRFTNADGTPFSSGIARWNGTNWSSLGTGLFPLVGNAPSVALLTLLPGGDIAVGGQFGVTGTATHSLARWNGATWSGFGAGASFGSVVAMTTMPNGDLIAGGAFTPATGGPGSNIARWNGTTWSPLGAGVNAAVRALAALPNGNVVAGGYFTSAGGVPARGIAQWNGAGWSSLGSGMGSGPLDGSVAALAVEPGGSLIAGGWFDTAGGVAASGVARWNGASWQSLGAGVGPIEANHDAVATLLPLPGGELLVGGWFDTAGSLANLGGLARWSGAAWSAFGDGIDGRALVVRTLASGDLLLGGEFVTLGGVTVNRIARFDGTSYTALGGGVNGPITATIGDAQWGHRGRRRVHHCRQHRRPRARALERHCLVGLRRRPDDAVRWQRQHHVARRASQWRPRRRRAVQRHRWHPRRTCRALERCGLVPTRQRCQRTVCIRDTGLGARGGGERRSDRGRQLHRRGRRPPRDASHAGTA